MNLDVKINQKELYKNLLAINKNLYALHLSIIQNDGEIEPLDNFIESFEEIINQYK